LVVAGDATCPMAAGADCAITLSPCPAEINNRKTIESPIAARAASFHLPIICAPFWYGLKSWIKTDEM